jgi:2-phosphosulfolactate phosphatase
MRVRCDLLPVPRSDAVVVVFDVLRMTSHACALFERGVVAIEVIAELAAARARSAEIGALLFGERGGLPPEGFAGGNSPLQTLARDLTGRTVILCTSNGSLAVEAAAGAPEVLLGSLVNAAAVAERLAELAPNTVTLSCAGNHGRFALEDLLGAAWLLRALRRRGLTLELDDVGALLLAVIGSNERPLDLMWEAAHARALAALGFAADVAWAGSPDRFTWVPRRVGVSPARFEASA